MDLCYIQHVHTSIQWKLSLPAFGYPFSLLLLVYIHIRPWADLSIMIHVVVKLLNFPRIVRMRARTRTYVRAHDRSYDSCACIY